MDLITAIRKSMTVFVCGIVGLIPLLGIATAVYALSSWRRVRAAYGDQWNPASIYLNAGAALALLGILSSILIIVVAALNFVAHEAG